MRVKENKCKEKRRYGWCASKEKNIDTVWGVGEEPGHNGVHHHTRPQHSVNDARHGQTLRAGEHLCHVMGNDECSPDWQVQFYVSPYARTRSMLRELRQYFLRKKIVDVRKESRVWERDFGNFQVKEMMKVIKKIRKRFERFFNQEENFNFSPFKRKLKFQIFSRLKFCSKISKI